MCAATPCDDDTIVTMEENNSAFLLLVIPFTQILEAYHHCCFNVRRPPLAPPLEMSQNNTYIRAQI